MVFNFHGAGDSLHHFTQKFFCKRHQVIVVAVSPVEFAGREFRVVSQINTFVSKLFSDFVNAVKTTNDELFKVELGRDTHV